MRRQGHWIGCSGDPRKSLQGYCAGAWRRPAVLGFLMYNRVHCGSCAPAATARRPLATPCSDFLRCGFWQRVVSAARTSIRLSGNRKPETRNREFRLCGLAGFPGLVQVHVALWERDEAAGGFEFGLELFEQLVADLPVVGGRDPGAYREIDAGIGKLHHPDDGCGIFEHLV